MKNNLNRILYNEARTIGGVSKPDRIRNPGETRLDNVYLLGTDDQFHTEYDLMSGHSLFMVCRA